MKNKLIVINPFNPNWDRLLFLISGSSKKVIDFGQKKKNSTFK